MWLPYVYKATNIKTNEFYIGMRSANKVVAEEDIGIKYFSSSKKIKQNKNDYKFDVIAIFINWASAFEFENQLIKENWNDKLLLNRHFQNNPSVFSMNGAKRPDLSLRNIEYWSTRKNPTLEITCKACSKIFLSKSKKQICCSTKCSGIYRTKKITSKEKRKQIPWNKGIKYSMNRSSWNKGLPNSTAAANGRRGAQKQSKLAKGRKRKYLPDGSWCWEYPKTKTEP